MMSTARAKGDFVTYQGSIALNQISSQTMACRLDHASVKHLHFRVDYGS